MYQQIRYYVLFPKRKASYKFRGNEIDTINNKILDKDYNQHDLFQGTPTFVKLEIKPK